MHSTWDSVNCIPICRRAYSNIAVFAKCIVISQLLVNYIPDHATKH